MAEKILENATCQVCGADARRNSLFCYNCGSAVSSESIAKTQNHSGLTIGDSKLGENPKLEEADVNKQRTTNPLDEPIPKPIDLPIQTKTLDKTKKPVEQTEYNLKTAAEIRQESKTALKKAVEISWQEPQNAPNFWFIIATIILTLFAVGILVAMLYIR